jgi:hypothetical protein
VKRRHLKKDLRKWVCSSSLRHYENTYERLYRRNRLYPDTKHAGILIMYLTAYKTVKEQVSLRNYSTSRYYIVATQTKTNVHVADKSAYIFTSCLFRSSSQPHEENGALPAQLRPELSLSRGLSLLGPH